MTIKEEFALSRKPVPHEVQVYIIDQLKALINTILRLDDKGLAELFYPVPSPLEKKVIYIHKWATTVNANLLYPQN